MKDYSFIDSNAARDTADSIVDEDSPEVRKWRLGSHSTASPATQGTIQGALDELDDDVDADLKAVLSEAASMVTTGGVRDFECPVCGLNHGHPDDKHDIRSAFRVTASFAEGMQYAPHCHCGANELAMLVDFYPYINTQVFVDGDNFAGVRDIDPEALRDIYNVWYQAGSYTVREAIEASAYGRAVEKGLVPDLKAFFQRVESIKSAANSAPIAAETRESIASARQDIEEAIDA